MHACAISVCIRVIIVFLVAVLTNCLHYSVFFESLILLTGRSISGVGSHRLQSRLP